MKRKTKFYLNGILLTLVGLAMRGTQLLFGAYIARALGASSVGINSLIMTVYSFALTLATSGVSLTVTRLVATAIGEGRGSEVRSILRGATLYSLIFGALSSLGLVLLSGTLGARVIGAPVSSPALAVLALSLLPSALSSVVYGYFVAVRRVAINALCGVFGQLLRIFLTVLLLTKSPLDPIISLSLGVTLSELAVLLAALPFYLVSLKNLTRPRVCYLSDVSKMALPLGISAIFRSALLSLEHNLIPRGLLKHGEDRETALASYGYLHGMALPLILYPMTPLSSFAGLLVPEFAEAKGAEENDRMRRIASGALTAALGYGISVATLVFLFSEELGYAVYSSAEAGRYIGILATVIPIMYLDHVADAILKGIGEHVYSMWVNVADAILSVVLVIILIPAMGISGYALIIIVMEAFNLTLSAIRLCRRIPLRLSVWGGVLSPLVCSLTAALVSDALFASLGAAVTPLLLFLKLTFSVCVLVAARQLLNLIFLPIFNRKKTGSARI